MPIVDEPYNSIIYSTDDVPIIFSLKRRRFFLHNKRKKGEIDYLLDQYIYSTHVDKNIYYITYYKQEIKHIFLIFKKVTTK